MKKSAQFSNSLSRGRQQFELVCVHVPACVSTVALGGKTLPVLPKVEYLAQSSDMKTLWCDSLCLALLQRGVSSRPAGRVHPDLHPGAEEGCPEGRLLPAADIRPPRLPTGASHSTLLTITSLHFYSLSFFSSCLSSCLSIALLSIVSSF